MIAEPPAPEKCIGDAMVNKGAEAPRPNLPPMKVRMLSSTAGGLLPASTASTTMRTIFPRPLFSWSNGEEAKERTGRTNFNQLAPPSWRKVIQTKSWQTRVFDLAVVQVVYAAARFWEGGTRCFVGRFLCTPDGI